MGRWSQRRRAGGGGQPASAGGITTINEIVTDEGTPSLVNMVANGVISAAAMTAANFVDDNTVDTGVSVAQVDPSTVAVTFGGLVSDGETISFSGGGGLAPFTAFPCHN